MDQFGVLVENYGIKPQGKSAPMAAVKSGIKTHDSKTTNSSKSARNTSSSWDKSPTVGHNDPIGFDFATRPQNSGNFADFGDGFLDNSGNNVLDIESMLRESMNIGSKASTQTRNLNDFDDIFGGFSSASTRNAMPVGCSDDLLSSTPRKADAVDELLGNLGRTGLNYTGQNTRNSNGNKRNQFLNDDHGDLIPGFGSKQSSNDDFFGSPETKGSSSAPLRKGNSLGEIYRTQVHGEDDLLAGFGRSSSTTNGFNLNQKATKSKKEEVDFFDIGSGSDTGNVFNKNDVLNNSHFSTSAGDAQVDLDSIFRASTPSTKHTSGSTTVDIDSFFPSPSGRSNTGTSKADIKHEAVPDLFNGTTSYVKKKPAAPGTGFDFGSVFGVDSSSGEFEEYEGETDERRKARWDVYQRTKARMVQALVDKNERDFQAQLELEEKHRIADMKEAEMKVWAAGKEGNLRALLSSLHQVLWPGCGWKPVSLTDLITSSQVKVAYKRACLCVHPDKVQQKGASVEQKYVAEKVFDLLKEASNKFNQEELR